MVWGDLMAKGFPQKNCVDVFFFEILVIGGLCNRCREG